MDIDAYLQDNLLSKENVRNLVDDYSIYSHYIGEELELNTKYSSPIREGDDDPSFSLFFSSSSEDLLFKDSARGISGDVFGFLKRYLDLSSTQVLQQINSDLELGLDGVLVGPKTPVISKRTVLRRKPSVIQITSMQDSKEYILFWGALDITKEVRDLYYCKNVAVIHFISEVHVTVVPKNLCISYEIPGFYKIYQPFESKLFKFRNNYPQGYVEGAIQLTFDYNFCIITKSTKECMFFRQHFNWDSVAGTSENTMISTYFFKNTLSKYKYVYVWLDNDKAGIEAQAKYMQLRPNLIPIHADKYAEKDPTDFYAVLKQQGRALEAIQYIKSLIKFGKKIK